MLLKVTNRELMKSVLMKLPFATFKEQDQPNG